tara:strand:- start:1641 stop:2762 length:1122 start_codon:yes stop_codon:yes gene_type:complete
MNKDASGTPSRGPLSGIKVLEMDGIGPGPFGTMLLADLGANVLTVGRSGPANPFGSVPVVSRGRSGMIKLDLKSDAGRERVLKLIEQTDVIVEGFRPGVMERLGLGPDVALERNPRLVYARMTGWGQSGPLAKIAGHDINYISLSGALHSMGKAGSPPPPPLNLVGDYGGGGMVLALGIVSALLETRTSGKGQVIDAAMVEGAGTLLAPIFGMKSAGAWPVERDGNMLDGSSFYYRCYECADGQFMSVGSLEPQFRMMLIEKLGLAAESKDIMSRVHTDAEMHQRFEAIFKQHDRAHWIQVFEGSDACVAPVMSMNEAPQHPHNQARKSFTQIGNETHPVRTPKFSRTPLVSPADDEADRKARLAQWGIEPTA